MAKRVFIDGGAGTTGLEIRERLAARADLKIVQLADRDRKDPKARGGALNEADVVILCLPDEAAREAVALIENPVVRVIDASTAHRVAEGWVYGFPGTGARPTGQDRRCPRVSNPGCYPTGFLALVRPLVRAGIVPADFPAHRQCGVRLFRRRQGDDRGIREQGVARLYARRSCAPMR